YIANVLAYIVSGLAASATGLLGLTVLDVPVAIQLAILLVVIGLLTRSWTARRRVEAWEIGLIAGLLAQFTLIALARVRFGLAGATDQHYVYVGVVYLLPLVANALRRLPWQWSSRPALVGGLALVVLGNAVRLVLQAGWPKDVRRMGESGSGVAV